MKTVIIGSGSWGTALGQVLVDNHRDVIIYGVDIDEVLDIDRYHQNSKFFDKLMLNYDLHATNVINVVKDADVVVLSIPSTALDNVCKQLESLIVKPTIIVNTAKGFHPTNHKRLSEVIKGHFPEDKLAGVVSLIGPSHAEEVVQRMLTLINAVSSNVEAAKTIQELFANDYFRVYTSSDVVGAEYGVALKNIMALASGILAGLDIAGDNAKAALMTRGLAEIVRYGVANGGQLETFLGLTGIGDLIVTCTSPHSRNFQAGYLIGKHDSAQPFWDNNTKTVEGVKACEIIYQEAKERNIEMPIVEQIYRVLYQGATPSKCIDELMRRELKSEAIK